MHTIEKEWTTESGLRAVVIMNIYRNRSHRCGYVGVQRDNPLFGLGHNKQTPLITKEMVQELELGKKSPILFIIAGVDADEDGDIRRSLDVLIDVHGGITYADSANTSDYPVPDEEYNPLWWFGFDTAHSGDNPVGGQPLDYCVAQCESMAQQLSKLSEEEEDEPS